LETVDVPRQNKPNKRLRRTLYVSSGVVGLLLVTFLLANLEPASPTVDRSAIWTDTVQRGEMIRSVRGPGTLVPERVRWIPASAGGRVEQIHAQPGDQVDANTLLLVLSNPDVQLEALDAQRQLGQAEAEVVNLEAQLETQRLTQESAVATLRAEYREARRRAEADRELAERELIARNEVAASRDRAEELAERLRGAEAQLEVLRRSATARLRVQRAQVDRLRSIVAFHEDRSASMQVRAGAEGVLQELPLQVGQWVTPGTMLARVADPRGLRAVLRIPETQARDLTVGQPARIDTRNGIVDGRVVRIDPAVQQGAVTVDVSLDGELPRGARPDLSVDGTILIDRLEDAVFVGRPAYAQPESRAGIWKVVEDGRAAVRVPVQLGLASVNTIEIVDGLSPGEEIILSDMSRWDDAERVRLRQ
jgi:HlyD family secretion protein